MKLMCKMLHLATIVVPSGLLLPVKYDALTCKYEVSKTIVESSFSTCLWTQNTLFYFWTCPMSIYCAIHMTMWPSKSGETNLLVPVKPLSRCILVIGSNMKSRSWTCEVETPNHCTCTGYKLKNYFRMVASQALERDDRVCNCQLDSDLSI